MPVRPNPLQRFAVLLIALAAVLLFLPLNAALAGIRPSSAGKPTLRIETGMHTATIRRIAVDKAGRYLVSGSDDKTVRVWDAKTGALLRTLRPPIGDGDEGKINAVAITPDGKTIICGGFTAPDSAQDFPLYVFDRASGALLRRVTGLPSVTFSLAVSPNGTRIAALGSGGLRMFRVADGSPAGTDANYGNQSYGADFAPDGSHLVTTCYDGFIRRYAVSGAAGLRLLAKAKTPGGAHPYSVRFSPNGTRVAIGYTDTAAVSVLAATDLSLRFAPDTVGIKRGNFLSVCWSEDGAALFAGGAAEDVNNRGFVRRWASGGAGACADTPAADNTLFDLRMAGGMLFYTSAEPTLGAINAVAMTRRWRNAPRTLDANSTTLGLDAGGTTVEFDYGDGALIDRTKQIRFDIGQRELLVRAAGNEKLFALGDLTNPPKTKAGGLTITDWKNSKHPKVNGTAIQLDQYEMSRSLAVAPTGDVFVLGTGWQVRCFGKNGAQRWVADTPDTAWGVNVSGDGTVAAAAFGDGTIRWYRMTDGVELCALFVHADRKRWVLWTPSGYYDCSPGGEDLIGWHINRGANHEADFFAASQFRNTFYRPDVLAQVLKTKNEAEAVRVADAAKGTVAPAAPVQIAAVLPPVVTILSPEDGAAVSGDTVTVRYSVRAPDDAPVTAVRALIDGRPAENQREWHETGDAAREIVVHVPARPCEIALVAQNKNAASLPATLHLRWAGAVAAKPIVAGSDAPAALGEFVVKPKLYVLAIGIGKFQKPGHDLDFPGKDAKDFAAAMQKQSGGLYRDVVTKVITDTDATHGEVIDGLDWVQHQTTAKDVAMVFLSGHGANDTNGNYYYLPTDFEEEHWKRTGVSFADISSSLADIKGKVLFFVDTCHSGNVLGTAKQKGDGVDIVKIVNELSSAENGVVVFASSTGKQLSLEDAAWNNGAFTKAVVEAVNGAADYQKTGRITINMLDLYISERVKELTKGTQTPTTTKPATVPDFPVALRK